jgi:hypothetical protein
MSFARNTTTCGPTKRWECKPRSAAGGGVNAVSTRTRRRGEYPAGSWVLMVDSDGKIKLQGEHWLISRALSGANGSGW